MIWLTLQSQLDQLNLQARNLCPSREHIKSDIQSQHSSSRPNQPIPPGSAAIACDGGFEKCCRVLWIVGQWEVRPNSMPLLIRLSRNNEPGISGQTRTLFQRWQPTGTVLQYKAQSSVMGHDILPGSLHDSSVERFSKNLASFTKLATGFPPHPRPSPRKPPRGSSATGFAAPRLSRNCRRSVQQLHAQAVASGYHGNAGGDSKS